MYFEWDEGKRRSNIEKHGLDFVRVAAAFDGRSYLEFHSNRMSESRNLRIAAIDDILVAVIWTKRSTDVIRLIPARRARDEERREYRALFG